VMELLDPEAWDRVHRIAREKEVPTVKAEREVVESDHARVGGKLLRQWGLPEELMIPVQYHHFPGQAPPVGKSLAMLVHAADGLVNQFLPMPDMNPHPLEVEESVYSYLRLKADLVGARVKKIVEGAARELSGT